MERVAGVHLLPQHFLPCHRDWVAQTLAQIHALPDTPQLLAAHQEQRFPWSVARWLPMVTQLRLLPERTANRLQALHDLLLASLDSLPAVRTRIHGDVQQGNILIDEKHAKARLIDFEYACVSDPMFDLAFFAVSLHLSIEEALTLLPPYEAAWALQQRQPEHENGARLALLVAYQRLFRHVASHKEYAPYRENDYDRWLSRLHDDVTYLQRHAFLPQKFTSGENA